MERMTLGHLSLNQPPFLQLTVFTSSRPTQKITIEIKIIINAK